MPRVKDNSRFISIASPRILISQFDSSLAELRVGYYLESKGFPILNWEPIPKSGNAGEFTIRCLSGGEVFVEVKSPGWESELGNDELKAGRAKLEKYTDNDGRCIAPHTAIQFAIRKAYKKFDPASSNLLVVADDLFVPLKTDPDSYAEQALYEREGYFTNSAYENLGGIGVFWIDEDSDPLRYNMKTFLNANALPTAALPTALLTLLK